MDNYSLKIFQIERHAALCQEFSSHFQHVVKVPKCIPLMPNTKRKKDSSTFLTVFKDLLGNLHKIAMLEATTPDKKYIYRDVTCFCHVK